MTDLEFYSRLNTLVEEAHRTGLAMETIIADLRLLARALVALNAPQE